MNPPVGATLCSINPWGWGAAGLIWNLPTHSHTPGVFGPHSRQTHTPHWGHFNGGRVFLSLFFFFLTDNWRCLGLPHTPVSSWPHLSVLRDTPLPACPPVLLVGEPQVLTSLPIMCLKLMVSDVNIIVNCSSVNFFVGGGQGGVRIRGSRICFHFQKKKKRKKGGFVFEELSWIPI